MTYDKLEKLMASINTLEVYTEGRIHLLNSDDYTTAKNDKYVDRVKRAKQEIFDLFQEK